MEDSAIVDLYLARREDAIKETAQKYGKYCYAISYRILHSDADAEECVNDAYMGAWNAIPPSRPAVFKAFLVTIVRRIAIKCYHKKLKKERSDVSAVYCIGVFTASLSAPSVADSFSYLL